jgi:nitrogen fixation/metabolism regulation signal transduction histidine kinase
VKAFNRLKISSKLGVAFLIVAIDITIVALVGLGGMRAINRSVTAIYTDRTAAIESLGLASTAFFQLDEDANRLIMYPEQRDQLQLDVMAWMSTVEQQLALYRATYLVPDEQEELTRFEPAWAAHRAAVLAVLEAVRSGDTAAARTLLAQGTTHDSAASATTSLQRLIEINDRVAREMINRAEATFWLAAWLMLVVGVTGLLLALALRALLTRALVGPLAATAAAAARIADGDLDQHLKITSDDEMGTMTGAFMRMVAYLREMAEVAERIAQGDLQATVVPRSERDVLGNAFSHMTHYLREMAEQANCIAQGDLSIAVRPRSSGDLLGNAFMEMLAYLRRMADVAERIAQGDLATNVTPQSGADVLGHASLRMTAYLQEMALVAQGIARGELRTQVAIRSQADLLGNSFLGMMTYLNHMATVAEQIAQGNLNTRLRPKSRDDDLGQALVRVTDYVRRMATAAERLADGDRRSPIMPASRTDALGAALVRLQAGLG